MAQKCRVCTKAVYPMDPQLNLDGKLFHKPCAKCADCQCQITVSNFAKGESGDQITLLCKTHYFKRFHEGGAYLGGDKYAKQAPRDKLSEGVAAAAASPLRSSGESAGSANDFPGKSPAPVSPAPAPAPASAPAPEPEAVVKTGCGRENCTCGPDCTCADCNCGEPAAETVFNTEAIKEATEEAAASAAEEAE
jgi:hypothetical protein